VIDLVLEGGGIEADGAGTLLTTTSCLLAPTRNPQLTQIELEDRLRALLGVERILWLKNGQLEGDDTDGHIDDLARFVAPGLVVACSEDDPADPNQAALADNLRRLRGARDAAGKPLEVAELPMPPPLHWQGERCPASYVNFYLANGVALVPVFGAAEDARALAVLREVLPQRELAPIPARHLVVGLGAVHCLTQQEPRASTPDPLAEKPAIR